MESLETLKAHIAYMCGGEEMDEGYANVLASATIMDSIGQFDRWKVWWANRPSHTRFSDNYKGDAYVYRENMWYWVEQHRSAMIARDIHQLPVDMKIQYAEELTREQQRFNELVNTLNGVRPRTFKKFLKIDEITSQEKFAGDLLDYYKQANEELTAMME